MANRILLREAKSAYGSLDYCEGETFEKVTLNPAERKRVARERCAD